MEKDYIQPNFYHFSEDSLWLVSEALKVVKSSMFFKEEFNLFDIFAGCGVVGIEFIKKNDNFSNIKEAFFIEKNSLMFKCLEENISLHLPDRKDIDVNLVSADFFKYFKKVELIGNCKNNFIIMNPPYFLSNPKRESKDPNKKSARFFEDTISVKDIFTTLDNWCQREELKVMGLVLYRPDQYSKDLLPSLNQKFIKMKIERLRVCHQKTEILFFQST